MLRTVRLCPPRPCLRSFSSAEPTGSDLIVDSLVRSGVKTVFGIPGNHTVPFYRAIEGRQEEISHFTMRHEGGAAFAADGYARSSGKLAAVSTITGTAMANTLAAMASALADSVPMVVLSSEASAFWRNQPMRQYSHFVPNLSESVNRSFAKASWVVEDVNDLETAVMDACSMATSGRQGPVHLSIPLDVFAAPAKASDKTFASVKPQLTSDAIAQLTSGIQALGGCERPLIIAGAGARDASKEVTKLAEQLGALVAVTPCAKGVIDERHPLSLGACLHLRAAFDELCAQADGLVLLGTKLSPTDFWAFGHHTDVPVPLQRFGSKTLHVDVDAETLKQVGVAQAGGTAVETEVLLACEQILSSFTTPKAGSWGGEPGKVATAFKARADDPSLCTSNMMWDFTTPGVGGHLMKDVLGQLRSAMPPSATLVGDVCRIGYTAIHSYPSFEPRTWCYPVGTTTLGYAMPAAVGVALAKPKQGVVLLAGDGGFQFTMQEMAVAALNELPILIVLWNDESYGEIRRGLGDFATKVPKPSFRHIAEAYSVPYIAAKNPSEVATALKSDMAQATLHGSGGPVFLEIQHPWNSPP